jgi:CheY-like chemotaxis protein
MKTVLLVDDDREMLVTLQQGLSRCAESFEVCIAADGIEALDCLQSQEISLVVTDLRMPRMDGFGLLAAIIKSYPDIPVIVISGCNAPDLECRVREGGAVAFIAKPFSIESLSSHIAEMLHKQAEGGTLHGLSSSMFLQLIEMEQKTCTIRLEDKPSGRRGTLFFVKGELFDARVGDAQGLSAAHEILAWDQVSLKIQNDCSVRERRIRNDLYSLILESARRKDERTPASSAGRRERGADAPLPAPAVEHGQRIRARLEEELGSDCGVEGAAADPVWNERLKRITRHGERLKLGKLIMAYVNEGDFRDYIVLSGEPATVLTVNPKCPREKIMQLLGG